MVVVLALAGDRICESFTHNPLTQDQGDPTFLSIMGIHKECIANDSESKYDFVKGQHVHTWVAMGDKQYNLHSQIEFVSPSKLGHS